MTEKNIYDKLPFQILAKNSASPTLMVIVKKEGAPYIMKVWSSVDKTREARGLTYENMIYEDKVQTLINSNPNLGLLKYVGKAENVTVQELGNRVGIMNDEELDIWKLVFLIYFRDTQRQFKYDRKSLLEYSITHQDTKSVLDIVLTARVNCIMLPYIKFKPLHSLLPTVSTERLKKYIRQLIITIHSMYTSGLVHNDLHSGNVMVREDNDDILIFDWDRAYFIGHDNPQLDKNKCTDGLCGFSQCNIYNQNGYAIDLYKILHYIINERKHIDINIIMSDIFQVHNRKKEPNVQNMTTGKLSQNPFFSFHNCTYLQYPDKGMKSVIKEFGTITEILINSGFSENQSSSIEPLVIISDYFNKPITESEQQSFIDITDEINRIIQEQSSISEEELESHFSFGGTNVMSQNIVQTQNINRVASESNIRTKIRLMVEKLNSISPDKATYGNLRDYRELLKLLMYGPVVQDNYNTFEGMPDKPAVYIDDIIKQSEYMSNPSNYKEN